LWGRKGNLCLLSPTGSVDRRGRIRPKKKPEKKTDFSGKRTQHSGTRLDKKPDQDGQDDACCRRGGSMTKILGGPA